VAEILDFLEGWIDSFPPGTVEVGRTRETEEYGPSTVLRLCPLPARACGLEVTVTDGGDCGFAVDSWSRLAVRLGTGVSRMGLPARDFTAIFREPARMSGGRVMEVCQAVADGAVHLEAGVLRDRIVCTRGHLRTASGMFRMHGVGGPLLVSRALGSVHRVEYARWVEGSP
jgi:hypothetical protein